ncbi:outer membrane efflux family protein, partial [Vibrio parahaemolyticus EKP-021]
LKLMLLNLKPNKTCLYLCRKRI